ncbi:MAG: hypothetical protein KAG95_04075 [Bacteroidales bacterium]|nr:hypothetical protein [Bacteroidales bacterium]
MIKIKRISSLILFLFFSIICHSQNNGKISKNVYGLNPVIYNGKIYTFSPSQDIKESPFLFYTDDKNKTNDFVLGEITIQDICYKNLLINYDVYNQKLLLEFIFLGFGKKIIEISEAWLQNFYIANKKFILVKGDKDVSKIYQTIGEKNLKFYYYWYNRLEMKSNLDSYNYYFSTPQKKMYLKKSHDILQFTNNRTLYKLFDKEQSQKIKIFLKKNRLKVKKASDEQMLKLIDFCNTL